ncbi:hypothetical protein F5884DRAFT_889772 [Xylogone sp. PMI_703]|nr:hypothetical protein F5884DRAFT_889772 [Xylogone sp. PMI_703]
MDSHINEHSSSASLAAASIFNAQQPCVDSEGPQHKHKVLKHRKSFIDALTSRFVSSGSQEYDNLDAPTSFQSRAVLQPSNTWTSSSGGATSEDDTDDRTDFIEEYNRIAKKYGLRSLIPKDFRPIDLNSTAATSDRQGSSWFSRKILRRSSATQSISDQDVRHKVNNTNLGSSYLKKSPERSYDLQELVRICGSSIVYLSSEYSASNLTLPTCLRATAQYLIQHAPKTRGIFRIPGAQSTVNALYKHYYALDENGAVISMTVRSPTLPGHIKYSVHDVASTFKKFLSRLSGGILGSVQLFDALVSINSHLEGAPEERRTRKSKVRSRLIALAIISQKSHYRRDLICAVFGILSMVGRAAETAPREDSSGRPLPTSDLMGYGALGIIFGPLLLGDLIDDSMILAEPHGGLAAVPVAPVKSRHEKHKASKSFGDHASMCTDFEKVKAANKIAEMLITHWRDVVRHIRDLKGFRLEEDYGATKTKAQLQRMLRSSASEFILRKPKDWEFARSSSKKEDGNMSPSPSPRGNSTNGSSTSHRSPKEECGLNLRKQRSRRHSGSRNTYSGTTAVGILSPTTEEPLSPNIGRPLQSDDKNINSTIPRKILHGTYKEYKLAQATEPKSNQNDLPYKSTHILESKDPLTRVSQDDDISSLMALSQAMNSLDKQLEQRSELISAENSSQQQQPKQDPTDRSSQRNSYDPVEEEFHSKNDVFKRAVFPKHTRSALDSENSDHRTTFGSDFSNPNYTYSSHNEIPKAGTVKALAAKLDTAQSESKPASPYVQISKYAGSGTRENINSPAKGILATYTTNSPASPSKSQKSRHSNVTPRSGFNKTPVNRSTIKQQKDSLSKTSGSGLCSRTPLQSLTAIRSARNNIPSASPLPSCNSAKSVRHDKILLHAADNYEINDLFLTTDGAFDLDYNNDPRTETRSNHGFDAAYNLQDNSYLESLLSRVPNPLASPESRNINSVLHSQVRMLQQQLYQKTEEVLNLNRQMNSVSNLDVKTMSDELAQIRIELENWKLKAEAAEDKVRLLKRLIHEGNSASELQISPASPSL